jgi:hypothetical protein
MKRKFQGLVKSILIGTIVSVFAITPVLPLSSIANAATAPVANPELIGACGWDIALVLDISASIGNTDLGKMKSAFITFVNNLTQSNQNEFSVTHFNTTASMVQPFSGDETAVTGSIQNSIPKSSHYTNWQDGLLKAYGTFPSSRSNPNLIIFASDGQPNRYGTDPVKGSGGDVDPQALDAAIVQANDIKTSGARIITLGISNDTIEANMKAISSEDAYYSAANFDQLSTTLNQMITNLCGTAPLECTYPSERSCASGHYGVCANGTQSCTGANTWGDCVAPAAGSLDCASSLDNNCNGIVDSTECGIQGNPYPPSGGGSNPPSGNTPTYLYCGDAICNNGEACSTCPQDCGACDSSNSQSPISLYIFNEQVVSASVGMDTANIVWDTNKSASSRLVYSAFNQSHTYDPALADYGYANTNSEDITQTINHSMTLTGLEPSTTYYVRAVSESGSESVLSRQLSFTTEAVAGATTQDDQGGGQGTSTQGQNNFGSTGEPGDQGIAGNQDGNSNSGQSRYNFLASIGGFFRPNFWIIIVVVLVVLAGIWLTGKNK